MALLTWDIIPDWATVLALDSGSGGGTMGSGDIKEKPTATLMSTCYRALGIYIQH